MQVIRKEDYKCVMCSNRGACKHHLLPKGAFPELKNKSWNKVRLCSKCHDLAHFKVMSAWYRKMLIKKFLPLERQEEYKSYINNL